MLKCWGSQRPLGCAARLCSPAGAPHESLSARRTCRPGRCVRTQGLCPAFRDCWCLGGLLCTAGPGETLRRQTRDPALAVTSCWAESTPIPGKADWCWGWGKPVRGELVGARVRRWALWARWPGGRAARPLQRECRLWDGRAHLSPAWEACPHTESSHGCLTLVFISQMGTWF